MVEQLEGLPGLADLARGGGPRAGRNFLAWFDAAWRQHDDVTALVAGEEGLRILSRTAERAALAERMAVMAHSAGRFADTVTARVEAWNSVPSLERLLKVVEAARRADVEEVTISTLAKGRARSGIPAPLRVVLLVLGGRLETATKEAGREGFADNADKLRSRLGRVACCGGAIPVLLTAGVDATRCDGFSESVIVGLLNHAEALVDRGQFRSSFAYRIPEDDDTLELTSDAGQCPALGDLLVKTLDGMTIPTAKRLSYLEAGTTLAANAVASIVGNKDRRRYSQAAALAVGMLRRSP